METAVKKFVIIISLCLVVNSLPVDYVDEEITCGYQACKPIKEDHINVHLVAHSHNDVGWVKTVDQYYYGVPVDKYVGAVQYIYQSVTDSLKRNKDRRFIVVETAFFWKWWQLQNEQTRDDFTQLVMSGQIEFTGGGWSMNDEAVTNYQSIIDQMTWGLKKLNDTFGECGRPTAGWQIDPFGHSSEMASIFSQLGYDGVILGRIDFQDKIRRKTNKTMDMVWRGSESLGESSDIFTSALYNLYDAPDKFCFETSCNPTPIIDDPESAEFNIDGKVFLLLNGFVTFAAKPYSTSNLLVPMGQDFAYQNAEMWYMNMDKLIKYINGREFNGKKYNLMYSTPACYIKAVHNETKGIIKSPLKTDDFFPYASSDLAYWTGFYTSRPQIKRFERIGNNYLQISKQLFSLSGLPSDYESSLNSLREAMGVLQHHDAITGTEKQVVANDYEKLLYKAIAKNENLTNAALKKLINSNHQPFEHCLLTNISQCTLSEQSDRYVVTVYNPLSRFVDKYIRLPVWGKSYSVLDHLGDEVVTQIIPIHSRILKIPGRTSNATLELVFQAKDLPPLGFKTFFVERKSGDDVTIESKLGSFTAQYENVGFDVDPTTGFVGKISFPDDVTIELNQTFQYYCGSIDSARPSGAYIFRRAQDIPLANVVEEVSSNKLYSGQLITELHQVYNGMVSQTVRIYHDEKFVEFDWIIGSLPNYMLNGREVITKYSTKLKSNATFYTDSNGREMLKRIRNFRPTWDVTLQELEPGNYYPVTSKITLKDLSENIQLSILTDRAQGGTSLEDGQIELMLHRNTQLDDHLGVDEILFDWAYYTGAVVRGSHYMVAGRVKPRPEDVERVVALERTIAERKLLDAWTFLSVPSESSFEEYKRSSLMEFYGLQMLLPPNVHILTLEPWDESAFLLRLEHLFAKDEDSELSQPVTINLSELFNIFEVISVRETTLGANAWKDESRRLKFSSVGDKIKVQHEESDDKEINEFEVILKPMEIRTFVIKTEPKMFYM